MELFINPVGTGVDEVALDARRRGERATSDHASVNHDPRAMADRGYRLVSIHECLDEGLSLLIGADLVRVDSAARQDKGKVIVWVRLIERDVDLEFVAVVPVSDHGDDRARLVTDEDGFTACFFDG